MEHKFSKGDRVKVVNPYYHELIGRSGTIVHVFQFSGNDEYSVEIEGIGALWVLKELDLEAEDV